jgi:formyltetrahydrofolate synthetase
MTGAISVNSHIIYIFTPLITQTLQLAPIFANILSLSHKNQRSYSVVLITHISKFMEDINNYISAIQQEIVAEEKTVKVARLIVLLIKIEKELTTVKETLAKLQKHQQKYNQDSQLAAQIEQKIATVNRLSAKISKARLNLNYYFI